MGFLDYLLIGAAAVFFFRLAAMERRNGYVWALASIAASVVARPIFGVHVLVGQAVLFCVMWAFNYFKPHKKIDV